jgi:hypothetical protein
MTTSQFISELIGLFVAAFLIMLPFALICFGRPMLNWIAKLISKLFFYQETDEYDENGDYIKR